MKYTILFILMTLVPWACKPSVPENQTQNPESLKKVEISIKGMTCTGCEETVSRGAMSLEGVTEATASFREGKAWITFDTVKVSPEQISASISKTGYQVTGVIPVN